MFKISNKLLYHTFYDSSAMADDEVQMVAQNVHIMSKLILAMLPPVLATPRWFFITDLLRRN